jgi:NADPH:quinone reductase-like Zn-dependent oxidoreductase
MVGATVIATGSDDEKRRAVKAEGADYVVNYRIVHNFGVIYRNYLFLLHFL